MICAACPEEQQTAPVVPTGLVKVPSGSPDALLSQPLCELAVAAARQRLVVAGTVRPGLPPVGGVSHQVQLAGRQVEADPGAVHRRGADLVDARRQRRLDAVIGQERAVQAIEFGLNMRSAGYNIFVTGTEGTGKSTIVRELASKHARSQAVPDDWCLVNNFQDEFRPRAIALPPGRGGKG